MSYGEPGMPHNVTREDLMMPEERERQAADEVKSYTRWTLDEDCLHIEASLPNSAKGALAALRRLGQQARAGLARPDYRQELEYVLKNYVETDDGVFTFPDGESWPAKKRGVSQ